MLNIKLTWLNATLENLVTCGELPFLRVCELGGVYIDTSGIYKD